jgi:hypothetical protein
MCTPGGAAPYRLYFLYVSQAVTNYRFLTATTLCDLTPALYFVRLHEHIV